jgi:hypothetical protein
MIAGAIFSIAFFVAGAIFLILLICSGAIFIRPGMSKTCRATAQYGDVRLLLGESEKSLRGKTLRLKSGDMIINGEYVILAYPLHVYIAPIKELIWAYIAFNVSSAGRGKTYTYYSIMLSFSSREQKAVRVKDRGSGMKELSRIKRLNPDVLIGFNQRLHGMYEYRFESFKKQVLTDVSRLQEGVSPGEQADIHVSLWGLEMNHESG